MKPYPPGTPLDIRKAKIRIGTVEKEMTVSPQAESADFVLELPAGKATLETWLTDDGEESYGAFYAYITKVN